MQEKEKEREEKENGGRKGDETLRAIEQGQGRDLMGRGGVLFTHRK